MLKEFSVLTVFSLILVLSGLATFAFANQIALLTLSTYETPIVGFSPFPYQSDVCYVGDTLRFYGSIKYKYLVHSATYSLYVDGKKVKTFMGYSRGYYTVSWTATASGTHSLHVVCEKFTYTETYEIKDLKTYSTPFKSNTITVIVNPTPTEPKQLTVKLTFDKETFYAKTYTIQEKIFGEATETKYGCYITGRLVFYAEGLKAGSPLKWEVLLGSTVADTGSVYYARGGDFRFAVWVSNTGEYSVKAHAWGSGFEGWSKTYMVTVKDISEAPEPVNEGAITVTSPVETQITAENIETGEKIQLSSNETIIVEEGNYQISSTGPIPTETEVVTVQSGVEKTVEAEVSQELPETYQIKNLGIVIASSGALLLTIGLIRKHR